jgi:tetratricopeptide (TPR) repeat protein
MFCARILFLLVFFPAALAQTPPNLDKLRAEGYDALFNLDYTGARRNFQRMIDLTPDNPAGPESYAVSLWFEQLNKTWELKSKLYSDQPDTDTNTKVDPRAAQEFRKWTRRTKQLAEARLRRDPRDVEALYFLGAAEGLEAAYAAAIEQKYMPALRTGSDAVDHHHKVLELSPQLYDAELTIGLQDYVIGALPLPLKMIAGTVGVRGSKKRGLNELEKVAREGQWARDMARVFLVDLYKREKRWDDAIATTRDLSARYPGNYLFKLQLAEALASKILAERKNKTAKPATDSAEQREVFSIYDSLLHDKALTSQAALIQSRRNQTARLLK